jgi:hypothetical protein
MTTWICPFCNQKSALSYKEISHGEYVFRNHNKYGDSIILIDINVCPNPDCKEHTLNISLRKYKKREDRWEAGDERISWQLLPRSKAKKFPEYVPKSILDDYNEACLICNLSPKASATLSRRCLQGMIRDFWKVSNKDSLWHEINAIKDRIDPLTWQAIDAVRKVGNISAHMEKDISLIVDVEPREAELLIGLIELLVKDWYIMRHEREEKLRAIVNMSDEKNQAKRLIKNS